MKLIKLIVLAVLFTLSTSVFANNYGFFGYQNSQVQTNYNVQQIMPTQNSNGTYTYSQTKPRKEKKGFFKRLKKRVSKWDKRRKTNKKVRQGHRYTRKQAYYQCLMAAEFTKKQCRQMKKGSRKSARAARKANNKKGRIARRAERKARRIKKRKNRKMSRYQRRIATYQDKLDSL